MSPVSSRRILRQHEDHQHHVYELTGPEILEIDGLAERYSRALRYPVSGVDLSYDERLEKVLKPVGIPSPSSSTSPPGPGCIAPTGTTAALMRSNK